MSEKTVGAEDVEISEIVRDVFSIAPSALATDSSVTVLRNFQSRGTQTADALAWVDFDRDYRFREGGVADVDTRLTKFIDDPDQDRQIAQITRLVADNDARPGSVFLNDERDTVYWLVPFSIPQGPTQSDVWVRCISVHQHLFADVIGIFNNDVTLTDAEVRVLFQLIAGVSMRSAAAQDGVSFETKRAQFKSASSKLQVTGQVEATRLLIGQMVHLVMLCASESRPGVQAAAFSSTHFRGIADLSARRLKSERLVRYWEMGPRGGDPLLVIHGYLFPFLMLNAPEYLERHNLRLIIPIRPGYLDGAEHAELSQMGMLPNEAVQNLLDFACETFEKPVPILGHATGALYAAKMIEKAPDRFSQFFISSINLLNTDTQSDTFSGRFFGGIKQLAVHHGMFDLLTKQYQRAVFSSEAMTRLVLKRLFKDCPDDLRLLMGDIGHGEAFSWYRQLHASSMIGIPSDFTMVTQKEPLDLSTIKTPVTFLHGARDPSTKLNQVSDLAAKHGASVKAIKDAGQLAYGSHASDLWRDIRDGLDCQMVS